MPVVFQTERPAQIDHGTRQVILRDEAIAHVLRETGDSHAIRAAERHELQARTVAESVQSLNAVAVGDHAVINRKMKEIPGGSAVGFQAAAVNDPPRPSGSVLYQRKDARAAVDHAAPVHSRAV